MKTAIIITMATILVAIGNSPKSQDAVKLRIIPLKEKSIKDTLKVRDDSIAIIKQQILTYIERADSATTIGMGIAGKTATRNGETIDMLTRIAKSKNDRVLIDIDPIDKQGIIDTAFMIPLISLPGLEKEIRSGWFPPKFLRKRK